LMVSRSARSGTRWCGRGTWRGSHRPIGAGRRIEVDVTSSNFPRRARNTNSGNPVLAHDGDAAIRVATNTVHHVEATPSFIELPMLTRG